MFLNKLPPVSNASRNISNFTSNWYSSLNPSSLNPRNSYNAGRCSHTGQTIIRTKSSLLRSVNLPTVNYNMRLTEPSFVSTLHLTPFSNNLISLLVLSTGEQTYIPALESSVLFSLTFFSGPNVNWFKRNSVVGYTLLYLANKLKKISNVELSPGNGVQYASSSGCWARVISTDNAHHSALVKLPSGVRNFFSLHSIVLPGPASLNLNRNLGNTNSGFWSSFGVKSIVRGVARNPVDHPHGGSTNAISYPSTPWGLTTKYK